MRDRDMDGADSLSGESGLAGMSPEDQRGYVPESPEALEAEFAGWKVKRARHSWMGTHTTDAVLHGEDLGALRDAMIGWRWRGEPLPDSDGTVI